MKRYLLIFDFDNTIINQNTDAEIIKYQSTWGQCISAKNFFTNAVGWAESMSYTLKDLHESNVTREKVNEIILKIPLTEEMREVFNVVSAHKMQHDCIMLSHSNSYFIDILLKKYNLMECFQKIYTYQCEWLEKGNGPLLVKPYDTLKVNCNICPPDFCKGVCVETHIEQSEWSKSAPYDSVVYVGDGGADFCAALVLKESDFVLARKDYSLHNRILKDNAKTLKAKPIIWETGSDIVKFLHSLFTSLEN